jgi:hypothetical protein
MEATRLALLVSIGGQAPYTVLATTWKVTMGSAKQYVGDLAACGWVDRHEGLVRITPAGRAACSALPVTPGPPPLAEVMAAKPPSISLGYLTELGPMRVHCTTAKDVVALARELGCVP